MSGFPYPPEELVYKSLFVAPRSIRIHPSPPAPPPAPPASHAPHPTADVPCSMVHHPAPRMGVCALTSDGHPHARRYDPPPAPSPRHHGKQSNTLPPRPLPAPAHTHSTVSRPGEGGGDHPWSILSPGGVPFLRIARTRVVPRSLIPALEGKRWFGVPPHEPQGMITRSSNPPCR